MISITFAGWMIPTLITIGSIFWALFIVKDEGGYLSGLNNIFALIPALAASLISWIVYVVVMAIFF